MFTGKIRQGTEGDLQELWPGYQPDRLAAREIPEGTVKLEEIVFQKIRNAYEVVTEAPGLRARAFWIEISMYGGRFPGLDVGGMGSDWLEAA